MSAMRSRSATIHGEGTRAAVVSRRGCARSDPSRRVVARNKSGLRSREHLTTSPVATLIVSPIDMLPDSSLAMMVLAVHVTGDHAADRDESRTGRYRREPTARKEDSINLVERQARFGRQCPGRDRIRESGSPASCSPQGPRTWQGGVAVCASGTSRQWRTFR